MASAAFAQDFCSDLDEVVKLARSQFRAIRDDTGRGALTTPVTRSLPGASWCWYNNVTGAYWCSWTVSFDQVPSRVKQLASAVGECYQVRAVYDTSLSFAFVDMPSSASVYVDGVGGMVFLSIEGASRERDIQEAP